MEKKTSGLAWIFLLLLALIWGSSFILIKKGLVALTPLQVGALRVFAASVVMLPLAIFSLKNLDKAKIKYLIMVGLAGSFIPSFLFAVAQTEIESSITGVLNALTPLFTILIGFLFYGKKQNSRVFVGVLMALAGTVMLLGGFGKGGTFSPYALLIILATVLYATNGNLTKYRLQDVKALTISSLSLSFMGPLAALELFAFADYGYQLQHVEGAWLASFYIILLGVIGTAVAWIIFNKLLQLSDPVFTSSVTYIIPVIAVVWGLADGEKLYWNHLTGMCIILGGVYIANTSSRWFRVPYKSGEKKIP